MAKMKISVDFKGDKELIAALRSMGTKVSATLVDAAEAGAEVIRSDAAGRAPGPHVTMQVTRRDAKRVQVDIGPDRDHWYYQFAETGSSPHRIKPNAKQALRFFAEGQGVIVRGVKHPGHSAKPFLRPAADENKERASSEVGRVIKNRALP